MCFSLLGVGKIWYTIYAVQFGLQWKPMAGHSPYNFFSIFRNPHFKLELQYFQKCLVCSEACLKFFGKKELKSWHWLKNICWTFRPLVLLPSSANIAEEGNSIGWNVQYMFFSQCQLFNSVLTKNLQYFRFYLTTCNWNNMKLRDLKQFSESPLIIFTHPPPPPPCHITWTFPNAPKSWPPFDVHVYLSSFVSELKKRF